MVQSTSTFYLYLKLRKKYFSGLFYLQNSSGAQALEMMHCFALLHVFQVYIWKAGEGKCNSHLSLCLLLDKQEEHNKNNGSESFVSSLVILWTLKLCLLLKVKHAWDHSQVLCSASVVCGVTCMNSV